MRTHSTIIDDLDGPHRVAQDLTRIGVPVKEVTVRAWKMRDSIPAKYWPHIQTIAAARGKPITLDELVEGIAPPKRPFAAELDAAA